MEYGDGDVVQMSINLWS